MCGQKPRLETSQRAKYLTRASGCEGLWSWAVLVRVRGWQGNSGRKRPQQVIAVGQPPPQSRTSSFAICFCLSLVLLLRSRPWGADCLAAEAAGSLQRRIPVGGAAFFSGPSCRGAPHAFSIPLQCFAASVTWNCFANPLRFSAPRGQTALKMENAVLLNTLNMAQSGVLDDSVWKYRYWHRACCVCL